MDRVIHMIFAFLFPPRCAGCKKEGFDICNTCLGEISYHGNECFFCGIQATADGLCASCKKIHSFDGIFWSWRYSHEKTRSIIGQFKYFGRPALAHSMALSMLARLDMTRLDDYCIVLPIPMHSTKEKLRGYNQAFLLAKNLSVPIDTKILKRIKDLPPQARTESRQERFSRMKNAFEYCRTKPLSGETIFLIDDVATTGATISSAAETLKQAGAGKIYALVLAHG